MARRNVSDGYQDDGCRGKGRMKIACSCTATLRIFSQPSLVCSGLRFGQMANRMAR